MKISVVAVGRLKNGPERQLADRYRERIEGLGRSAGLSGFVVTELTESRARHADERRKEEGTAIRARVASATLILFDERAVSMTSEAFANRLRGWRDGGVTSAALAIGGPDGLDPALHAGANLAISFGALTIPHQLVRILVIEQIYRALTILAGHPYHRVGSDA